MVHIGVYLFCDLGVKTQRDVDVVCWHDVAKRIVVFVCMSAPKYLVWFHKLTGMNLAWNGMHSVWHIVTDVAVSWCICQSVCQKH